MASNFSVKPFPLQFCCPEIFGKFGAIDAFEMFKEKFPKDPEIEEWYAFATYVRSEDAYRAIWYGTRLDTALRIVFADTWKQPDAKSFLARNEDISLNILPDDCLIVIFGHFDLRTLLDLSKVCQRFKDIAHRHFFPFERKLELSYKADGDIQSIEFIWDVFSNVLCFATEVKFIKCHAFQSQNEIRLTDVFTKKLGENLERLELVNVFITARMHEQLKPVFERLRVMKYICDRDHGDYEVDFAHFCPVLKKLHLEVNMELDKNVRSWPSLESVSINPLENSHFFWDNEQLKRIKIKIHTNLSQILMIWKRNPNAETLKIHIALPYVPMYFSGLTQLKRLKTLRLVAPYMTGTDLVHFTNSLSELPCLERLEIRTIKCDFPLSTPFLKMENLKVLHVENEWFTEEALILLLEAAPKLATAELLDCFDLDELLLAQIVNIRRKQAQQTISAILPLEIFVNNDSSAFGCFQNVVTVHSSRQNPIIF